MIFYSTRNIVYSNLRKITRYGDDDLDWLFSLILLCILCSFYGGVLFFVHSWCLQRDSQRVGRSTLDVRCWFMWIGDGWDLTNSSTELWWLCWMQLQLWQQHRLPCYYTVWFSLLIIHSNSPSIGLCYNEFILVYNSVIKGYNLPGVLPL